MSVLMFSPHMILRTGALVQFGGATKGHRLLFPLGRRAVWRSTEINSCSAPTFSLRQQTSGFEPFGVSTKECGGPCILMLASLNPNSLPTSPQLQLTYGDKALL